MTEKDYDPETDSAGSFRDAITAVGEIHRAAGTWPRGGYFTQEKSRSHILAMRSIAAAACSYYREDSEARWEWMHIWSYWHGLLLGLN